MVGMIVSYFKEIAGFLIFMSIAAVVVPKKYERYVRLCAGLVMIIIAIGPMSEFLNRDWRNNGRAVLAPTVPAYSAAGETSDAVVGERIVREYKAALSEHLRGEVDRLSNETGLRFVSAEFHINEDYGDEYFGAIYGVTAVLAKAGANETPRPFIYIEQIEPVSITPYAGNAAKEGHETDVIKKAISDFYNLSFVNINIVMGEG